VALWGKIGWKTSTGKSRERAKENESEEGLHQSDDDAIAHQIV